MMMEDVSDTRLREGSNLLGRCANLFRTFLSTQPIGYINDRIFPIFFFLFFAGENRGNKREEYKKIYLGKEESKPSNLRCCCFYRGKNFDERL